MQQVRHCWLGPVRAACGNCMHALLHRSPPLPPPSSIVCCSGGCFRHHHQSPRAQKGLEGREGHRRNANHAAAAAAGPPGGLGRSASALHHLGKRRRRLAVQMAKEHYTTLTHNGSGKRLESRNTNSFLFILAAILWKVKRTKWRQPLLWALYLYPTQIYVSACQGKINKKVIMRQGTLALLGSPGSICMVETLSHTTGWLDLLTQDIRVCRIDFR